MFSIAASAWSITGDPRHALDRVSTAGFDLVDLRPDCWRGIRAASELRARGLAIACVDLAPVTMTPGLSLDTLATPEAGRVLPYLRGTLERAASLGARYACLDAPSARQAERNRYARAVERLADAAGARGLKMCLKPGKDRLLATTAEVVSLIRQTGHGNLYVLLDAGRCLSARENIAQAVEQAGSRLGYARLALCEGALSPGELDEFLDALARAQYDGPIGLEADPSRPGPLTALVAARDYIQTWSRRRAATART